MEQKPIVARCILDILGAPKEYIEKKLKEHIDKLQEEKLEILREDIAEPEQKDTLFTSFAELEIRFKNPRELLDFCFDSMPSSVEILEPETITLTMQDLSGFLNDFQSKMHHIDSMVRTLQMEKKHIDANALNVFNNFIKYALKQQNQTTEALAVIMGVKTEQLTPFLKHIEEKGKIKKEGEKWTLNMQ
ncbi:hypothetical protein KY329_04155 [Candidatus Woesearchaeota archaeon]|nr:hypothetical protein [Candidatus Woesearchaeota archaeon]